jgi:Phasin protein
MTSYGSPSASPDFIKMWEEIRDEWLARMKSETDLATELMERLRSSGSFPDAMSAYQEWMSRRMERFAEDSRRFWADAQKIMEASARMVSQPGSWIPGRSPGTGS